MSLALPINVKMVVSASITRQSATPVIVTPISISVDDFVGDDALIFYAEEMRPPGNKA